MAKLNNAKPGLGRLLGVAAALILLAGCGSVGLISGWWTDEAEKQEDLRQEYAEIAARCPVIKILKDAGNITRFNPPSAQSEEHVLYRGELTNVALTCEIEDGMVVFDIGYQGTLRLGPAATEKNAVIDVFYAVTENDQRIIKKDIRRGVIEFDDFRQALKFSDVIEQISFAHGGTAPSDYEVLIGFQVSKKELEYNRLMRR